MNVIPNNLIDNKYCFWKRNKYNPYGAVEKPIPRDELIIKRTKETLFADGALGLLSTCIAYFKIKEFCIKLNVRDRAVKNYSHARLGNPPKRLNPIEEFFKKEDKPETPEEMHSAENPNPLKKKDKPKTLEEIFFVGNPNPLNNFKEKNKPETPEADKKTNKIKYAKQTVDIKKIANIRKLTKKKLVV